MIKLFCGFYENCPKLFEILGAQKKIKTNVFQRKNTDLGHKGAFPCLVGLPSTSGSLLYIQVNFDPNFQYGTFIYFDKFAKFSSNQVNLYFPFNLTSTLKREYIML